MHGSAVKQMERWEVNGEGKGGAAAGAGKGWEKEQKGNWFNANWTDLVERFNELVEKIKKTLEN